MSASGCLADWQLVEFLGQKFTEVDVRLDQTATKEEPREQQAETRRHFEVVAEGLRREIRQVAEGVLNVDEGAKSIVITSTGPGEGKTVVAANLALALAQAGQRVLLLDADMRQPSIHELFRLKQDPGLSNVLVGKAKASEAVKKSGLPGLWIMPSGTHPPNPSELLGSGRFRDFVAGLQEHFDWVVFDSPPVMAVTDATVLAHWATAVLFVVGAEMTGRQTAQVAIENLDAAKGRLLGAILNRVAFERHGYYYSHYYRREYSHYYSRP